MKMIKASSLIDTPKSLSDIMNLYGDLPVSNFTVKQEYDTLPWFEIEGCFHPVETEEQTVQEILDTMTDAQRKYGFIYVLFVLEELPQTRLV